MSAGIYTRTPEHREKIRAGIAKAQAAGKPFGRTRVRPLGIVRCEVCGVEAMRAHRVDSPGRFCVRHRNAGTSQAHRKVHLSGDELRALYWSEGLSLHSIGRLLGVGHTTVGKNMRALGVPRRGPGRTRPDHCIEPGCVLPIQDRFSATLGVKYGVRCAEHLRQFKRESQRRWWSNRGRDIAHGLIEPKIRRREWTTEQAELLRAKAALRRVRWHLRRSREFSPSRTSASARASSSRT